MHLSLKTRVRIVRLVSVSYLSSSFLYNFYQGLRVLFTCVFILCFLLFSFFLSLISKFCTISSSSVSASSVQFSFAMLLWSTASLTLTVILAMRAWMNPKCLTEMRPLRLTLTINVSTRAYPIPATWLKSTISDWSNCLIFMPYVHLFFSECSARSVGRDGSTKSWLFFFFFVFFYFLLFLFFAFLCLSILLFSLICFSLFKGRFTVGWKDTIFFISFSFILLTFVLSYSSLFCFLSSFQNFFISKKTIFRSRHYHSLS